MLEFISFQQYRRLDREWAGQRLCISLHAFWGWVTSQLEMSCFVYLLSPWWAFDSLYNCVFLVPLLSHQATNVFPTSAFNSLEHTFRRPAGGCLIQFSPCSHKAGTTVLCLQPWPSWPNWSQAVRHIVLTRRWLILHSDRVCSFLLLSAQPQSPDPQWSLWAECSGSHWPCVTDTASSLASGIIWTVTAWLGSQHSNIWRDESDNKQINHMKKV